MSSVFASPQTYNGGFRADKLKLQIAGTDVAGMLFQNVQFSFTQQITMLYEIGSSFVYYVGGRAQGTATIAFVVGPGQAQSQLLQNYGDLCNPKNIGFKADAGCEGRTAGGINYTLISAVLTTVAGSVNSNDLVINQQLQFMFIDLQY
jgi:hypothetical protein